MEYKENSTQSKTNHKEMVSHESVSQETKNLNIEVPANLLDQIRIIAILNKTSMKKVIINFLYIAVGKEMERILPISELTKLSNSKGMSQRDGFQDTHKSKLLKNKKDGSNEKK